MTTTAPKHKTNIEVRFADIDLLGHVNNANYLSYMEQARIRYFDEVVGAQVVWTKQGIILARAEINFRLPVKWKDQITVYTSCTRLGTKSFDLTYRIVKQEGSTETIVAEGLTVMVCYDYTENITVEMPEEWKKKVQEFESKE